MELRLRILEFEVGRGRNLLKKRKYFDFLRMSG